MHRTPSRNFPRDGQRDSGDRSNPAIATSAMTTAKRVLSHYSQFVLEALYLRTMFLTGADALHLQIGLELDWRRAESGARPGEIAPTGIHPSPSGQRIAQDWNEMRDAGERWIPIWSGDGLTLRLGSTLLLLQSIRRGVLECHIPIDRARLTFSARSATASLDWDGGSLELDRLTAEALVVWSVRSIDARQIEESLAEMLAHQALSHAMLSARYPHDPASANGSDRGEASPPEDLS
jgi:hypothetical protein